MVDPSHDETAHAQLVQACLQRVLDVMTRPGSLEQMLARIHDQLWSVLDASNLYFALYDELSQLYVFPYSTDDSDDDDFTPQELACSLTDYVRRSNEPLLCTEAGHLWLAEQDEVSVVGTPSPVWIGVPLATDTGVVGVMSIQSYVDAAAYDARDLTTLALIGRCIAHAVESRWVAERETAEHMLRVRALAASRDEALAASHAKSRFLAVMSHELRTPLTAILGYAELLREELEEEGWAHAEDAARIERASRHLMGLVTEVLDLSRIEADMLSVHPVEVDLDDVIDQVEALTAGAISTNGNRLHTATARGVGRVLTDPVKVQQVLVNLVANAARHTRDGQITVRAQLEDDAGPQVLRLEVSDTGEGIPEEQLEAIFQPFEQGAPDDGRTQGAAGLGLAIVRGLCERLGGGCDARSVPGRGSTFTARLQVGRI